MKPASGSLAPCQTDQTNRDGPKGARSNSGNLIKREIGRNPSHERPQRVAGIARDGDDHPWRYFERADNALTVGCGIQTSPGSDHPKVSDTRRQPCRKRRIPENALFEDFRRAVRWIEPRLPAAADDDLAGLKLLQRDRSLGVLNQVLDQRSPRAR